MRLRSEQVEGAVSKKLLPIYLVTGDEPLQLNEVADSIRLAAKQSGYDMREVLSVESNFNWAELSETAHSLSLFAEKKLIDLRLPSGKPGNEGAKAITEYCKQCPEDNLLLITTAKLTAATLKSKWCQSIDKQGGIIQVWPLEGGDLIQWLQQRARKRGLKIEQEGVNVLASRVEGNLLAAAQEIEKLYILHGQTSISKHDVENAVADSARFDVFKLTDCVLSGRVKRAVKILNGLKAEGVAAPVVVWALAREARLLVAIKTAIKQGQNKELVFKNNRLWDKRKQLVNAALSRMKIADLHKVLLLSSQADRQIKGQEQGDCWETLLAACVLFHAS